MVRLRNALGVASLLVAMAALSVVFAGSGEAQGSSGPSVTIANTPLPVTGNVNATMSGNVSANIINPANSPVLVRDVDARGAKELWQRDGFASTDSGPYFSISFGTVPEGKALVIEHVDVIYEDFFADSQGPSTITLGAYPGFEELSGGAQHFVHQPFGGDHVVNAATKFYARSGAEVRIFISRPVATGISQSAGVLTGYLIDYP